MADIGIFASIDSAALDQAFGALIPLCGVGKLSCYIFISSDWPAILHRDTDEIST